MVPGLWLEPEVIGVNSPMAAPAARRGVPAARRRAGRRARPLPPRPAPPGRASRTSTRSSTGWSHDFGDRLLQARLQHRPGSRAPTATPTASATACSSTTAPTSPGSTACSTGTPTSSSRTAPRARCGRTSRCCRGCRCSRPPTSRTSSSTRRSRRRRRCRCCPEQAASWAYPQPDMTAEEIAFCLATGLLGRFYLSGLPQPDDRRAARAGRARPSPSRRRSRGDIASSTPVLAARPARLGRRRGRPSASRSDDDRLVTVWNRTADGPTIDLLVPRPGRPGSSTSRHRLPACPARVDDPTGTRKPERSACRTRPDQVGARVFRVTPSSPDDHDPCNTNPVASTALRHTQGAVQ